jgi:hypothetical protein
VTGKQPSLFRAEQREVAFLAFHDESGRYKTDRWFIVGLLLLPAEAEEDIVQALAEARRAEGYQGEVHFNELAGSWSGAFARKALVARRWLKQYVSQLSQMSFFYALAIDTRSPAFDHARFPRRHFAYNRFTRMALTSALAWELHRYSSVALQVYSDEKTRGGRRADLAALTRADEDNFEEYISRAVEKDVAERRAASGRAYPRVRSLGDVITLNPRFGLHDPRLRPKAELLQLADVILGAVAQAIHPGSSRATKRDLGCMVADWILDTRKEPWKQRLDLHRRFSVAYFPDADGRPYTDGPLTILSLGPSQQLTLGL